MERQKILFADDDPEIREVLRLLLESEGYQAVEASSGTQVLEKLDDSVGLVILDVMMPDINGYGVCAEIRKRSAVPVLFLTAKSQDSDKTLGFSAGGDDYLVKPFSYSELISRVKAMLRRYYVYGAKQSECGAAAVSPGEPGAERGGERAEDHVEHAEHARSGEDDVGQVGDGAPQGEAGHGVGGEEREDAQRLGDPELHGAPGEAAEEQERHERERGIDGRDHADARDGAGVGLGV